MTTAAPTLRPYQTDSLDAIVAAVRAGQHRLLLKKPTGTGKTVTFAAMLKWPGLAGWLAQFPDQKMLVIAHREELLDQAADKIRRANPGLMVSIEQGPRTANPHADVIIASIQTLQAAKFRRLKRLLTYGTFRLVVVDEAHHAAAPTYRTALVYLGFLPPADATETEDMEAATETDVAEMERNLSTWDEVAPRDRLLVGVTATPNRTDAIGLGCVFQSIVYNYALKQAIADGYLVPIVPWVVETKTSLDDVRLNRGEFHQKDLAEAVNNDARNETAVAAWLQYAAGRQTLAFTVDVAHAHALAESFVLAGVKAEALSGETPKDDRRRILADYAAGTLQVITNCMVLTEGTDLPTTSCILHAKPTKSATLYEQMTGRGLRVHPVDPAGPGRLAWRGALEKQDCIIIDVVDIARKHSLQTAPALYGLPPNIDPKGQELSEFERALEDLLSKLAGLDVSTLGRTDLAKLQVRASTFDIWQVPELGVVAEGLQMQWVKTGDEVYRLQYPWNDGMEVVTVAPNLISQFDINLTFRPAGKMRAPGEPWQPPPPARHRTITAGLETAREALKAAEAFVSMERTRVVGLKAKTARWRHAQASPRQVALLRKLGAPIKAGLTGGEASDMIDVWNARKRR